MFQQSGPESNFRCKLLILNRMIALSRFAEPFQNLSNHFKKGCRAGLSCGGTFRCGAVSLTHFCTSMPPSMPIFGAITPPQVWTTFAFTPRLLKSAAHAGFAVNRRNCRRFCTRAVQGVPSVFL